MSALRAELLRFAREDGGVDLYDPLLERIIHLAPGEEPVDPLLFEGPLAERLRAQIHARFARPWPTLPAVEGGPIEALDAVPHLHPEIADPWRRPEPWRRLIEEGRAGGPLLRLPGLLGDEAVSALIDDLERLEWQRLDTAAVRARRAPLPCPAWIDAPFRALCGAALGRALPMRFLSQGWRMEPGDGLAIHPDGARYAATLVLGLSPGWTAAMGGALAFGEPSLDGLRAPLRWLPQAGDALLFAPHATSFHAVEPVRAGRRQTLTGWWMD